MNARNLVLTGLLPYRSLLRRGTFPQWRRLIFRGIRGFTGNSAFPWQAVIALTYRCQCHCRHCCMGQYAVDQSGEMSGDEISSLLRRLRDLGVCFVTWFGGEPLLRDELPQFVAQATALGMFTTVETNGLALDGPAIDRLRSAGLSRLCISLDSSDESFHDAHRGYAGSFSAACRAVEMASATGLPCTVSVTVQRELLHNGDVTRLIELAKRLGASSVRLIPPVCTGRWVEEEVRLLPDDIDLLRSIHQPGFTYIEHMRNNTGNLFYCDAADLKKIYISCYGDVHPCESVPVSFGNIREEEIGDILRRMGDYPDIKSNCGDCITHCDHTRGLIRRQLDTDGDLPVRVRDDLK